MRREFNSSEVFARPESVGEDFALILEAFADAFRILAPASPRTCNCPTLHFAGWR